MSEPRTYKITSPPMKGDYIERSQVEVRKEFERMGIDYPLEADGVYGAATRAAYASLCTAQGILHYKAMEHGVTPELRSKLRHRSRLTAREKVRMFSPKAVAYRRNLRDRYKGGGVAPPLAKILSSSWGYHPPVHDGVDLICPPNATLYAMCKSIVVRADRGGWWGKAPSGDVSKGDGIIILRVLEDVGPFKKGLNLCYGHAERPAVRVGQVVNAGDPIGKAGLAVAWHIHAMVNRRSDTRGVGDRDPMPFITYARRHG